MSDNKWIYGGLLVFLVLLTFPFWYNRLAASQPFPTLEMPKEAQKCVEETQVIKATHMELLNTWRDQVVREQDRIYVAADGTEFNMSLTETCLGCHNKAGFCDKCHDYSGVSPYCWDCHLDSVEVR